MLLNKQEKEMFISDYRTMSKKDLAKKYKVCAHKIKEKAIALGIYKNKIG